MVSYRDEDEGERPLPPVLRERLGIDGSAALAGYVSDTVNHSVRRVISESEERFVRHLRQELSLVRTEFRQELKQELALVRAEMHEGLAVQRADLLKWMFMLWVGQAAVTVGLILAIR